MFVGWMRARVRLSDEKGDREENMQIGSDPRRDAAISNDKDGGAGC